MLLYLISFIAQTFLLVAYFRIGYHFNITDSPNKRSSHSYITIRGGGIVFPAAALLWFLMYGFNQPWLILALLLIAAVSFLDDVITLASKFRILVHFSAVTLLFWQLQVFGFPWYCIVLAYLFTIGWINAFNFMDGINGLAGLAGLIAFGSLAFVAYELGMSNISIICFRILSCHYKFTG